MASSYSKGNVAAHSAEEQQKLLNKYHASLGLKKAQFNSDAFDKVVKERAINVAGLAKVKDAQGAPHYKKLVEAAKAGGAVGAAAKAVEDEVKDALVLTSAYAEAQKKFAVGTAEFQALIDKIPEKYSAYDVINVLKELKDNSKKAIEEQYKHEKEQLEARFKDDGFKKNLVQALDIDASELEAVQKNMVADLEKDHKERLAEFDKTAEEQLNAVHKAAAAEKDNLLLIAHLKEHGHKSMHDKLFALAAKNAAEREEERKKAGLPPKPLSAAIGITPDAWDLSGIRVEDLDEIRTKTNRKITKDPNNPERFILELPANGAFWKGSLTYYKGDKVLSDMICLARTLKALGNEKITLTIDKFNEQDSFKQAQNAYEAGIEAGFKPEQIQIKVNGKLMKTEEIFKENPQRLEVINQRSGKIIEDLNKVRVHSHGSTGGVDAVKKELQDLKAKAAAAAPASPSPSGPGIVI